MKKIPAKLLRQIQTLRPSCVSFFLWDPGGSGRPADEGGVQEAGDRDNVHIQAHSALRLSRFRSDSGHGLAEQRYFPPVQTPILKDISASLARSNADLFL